MSSFRRNILVGGTILVALVLLGWMILRFGEAPMWLFAQPQIAVKFVTSSAEGLSEGSAVAYKGVTVGRVVALRRSPDQRSVIIDALVDKQPPLPGNVHGRIRSQLFGGGSTIDLVLVNPTTQPSTQLAVGEPAEPTPQGMLRPGQIIESRYVGVDILPREYNELAVDLKQTSRELRQLSAKVRESDIIPNLADAVRGVKVDVEKVGLILDKVNGMVGDDKLQADIRQSLANFRAASESATRIGQTLEKISVKADARFDELAANGNKVLTNAQGQIDQVGVQIGRRMTQLAGVLENLEAASRKINEGKGSAAQFLNNPALYENLLDTSKELNLTIADLRRLVEQWEQEGVPLRLGGGGGGKKK